MTVFVQVATLCLAAARRSSPGPLPRRKRGGAGAINAALPSSEVARAWFDGELQTAENPRPHWRSRRNAPGAHPMCRLNARLT
jgi:hypothetical protein